MKPHSIHRGFDFHTPTAAYPSIHRSSHAPSCANQERHPDESHHLPSSQHVPRRISHRRRLQPVILGTQSDREPTAANPNQDGSESTKFRSSRRGILLPSLLAAGAYFLRPTVSTAEEASPPSPPPPPPSPSPPPQSAEEAATAAAAVAEKAEETEAVLASRIYDASVIGEPLALGKDKKRVFEKLMNGRVVYLGEAEQVPTRDDKELELEIIKSLRRRCAELDRPLNVAIEAFPSDLQGQLNDFIDGRMEEDALKSVILNWPAERWQEYQPLLKFCREKGIRLIACGTPLQVLRTVQAEGIRGLSKSDRKKYAPPAGSGFISGISPLSRTKASIDSLSFNQTSTFGPTSYLTIQARAVEDYSISQVILQTLTSDGGANGLLVVITGASHVMYGGRGTGIPARISRKMQKKNQIVLLLNPERQFIRREGEVPVADFLWYSAARTCSRNCYDRAEIARVMNAAGRRRDALPQDLQKGLDLGLVSPEVLQNFFDLEKYPFISELTHRFQGFRERLLADPKFLNRLAIEESISITTTLVAQYQKRKENFFQEIDYVITDSIRGAVVDFFTVWLPAPTLSFLVFDYSGGGNNIDSLIGLLGSIPDNAFQKSIAGRNWDLNHRVASVVVGGLKLAAVGFVSSIGAVGVSNAIFAIRRSLNPAPLTDEKYKRSPILKTAVVYSSFLGVSANLRYQVIAGVIEHRVSELIPSETLLINVISFVARVINSFWGTQQWIDIARYTGIQSRKTDEILEEATTEVASGISAIECSSSPEEASIDDVKNE